METERTVHGRSLSALQCFSGRWSSAVEMKFLELKNERHLTRWLSDYFIHKHRLVWEFFFFFFKKAHYTVCIVHVKSLISFPQNCSQNLLREKVKGHAPETHNFMVLVYKARISKNFILCIWSISYSLILFWFYWMGIFLLHNGNQELFSLY